MACIDSQLKDAQELVFVKWRNDMAFQVSSPGGRDHKSKGYTCPPDHVKQRTNLATKWWAQQIA